MTDTLVLQLEAEIHARRLLHPAVDWAEEIIFPAYESLSLRNIAHTVAAAIGVPLPDSAPLDARIWGGQLPDVQRVIVYLLDGFGYRHLQMLMAEDGELADAVAELTDGKPVMPLTSIAPSTTAVALTTLWTGSAPGQTGILGTQMWLSEISALGDMLRFAPSFADSTVTLDDWNLPAEKIVQVPSLSDHLRAHDVPSYAVTFQMYFNTGLGRVLHRGLDHARGHTGNSDFILRVGDTLRETRGQRCYVGIYSSGVDTLAHRYGAHTRYTHIEARKRLLELRDLLRSDEVRDGNTLFMLLADHGHYDSTTPIELKDDPIITDAMRMSGYGDERHMYLQVLDDHVERLQAHIHAHYGDKMAAIRIDEAIEAGYFGGSVSPLVRKRMGDLLLIPRLGWVVADPVFGTLPMISRHAGLSEWEMMIPLLWRRL